MKNLQPQKLQEYVDKTGIKALVKIVGIIPREEQICLLANSLAVIQPSLFEGWSTIIEDAKTLQISVIASDIAVHIEQLGDKGTFFKSTDSESLANLMRNFALKKSPENPLYDDYKTRAIIFANQFINVFCK